MQTITIGREGYIVGEALFQPSILGLEEYGIVEQLVRSISSVSSENLRQLLENTMLCGGTASMSGMNLYSMDVLFSEFFSHDISIGVIVALQITCPFLQNFSLFILAKCLILHN